MELCRPVKPKDAPPLRNRLRVRSQQDDGENLFADERRESAKNTWARARVITAADLADLLRLSQRGPGEVLMSGVLKIRHAHWLAKTEHLTINFHFNCNDA
jgi:hypothetical protein